MKRIISIILTLLLFSTWTTPYAQSNLWAIKAGGIDYDSGRDVATDAAGNSYMTGVHTSKFSVAKYDASGNVVWARNSDVGLGSVAVGNGVAVDNGGNSYLIGHFFDYVRFGQIRLNAAGESDILVAKYDPKGSLLWAISAGGVKKEESEGIAVDHAGNCYVTGFFYGSMRFGEFFLTSSGQNDMFLAKIDSDGNVIWAKSAGGQDYGGGLAIATDKSGDIYVSGYFSGDFYFGNVRLVSAGGSDIFLAKFDTDGNLKWAKRNGGTGWEGGYGVAADEAGNVYVTGGFQSTAMFDSLKLISAGGSDIFLAKYDWHGNVLWAVSGASIQDFEFGYDASVDTAGNIYITGCFKNTVRFDSVLLIGAGDYDAFIAKYDSTGNLIWATRAGGPTGDYGYGIAVDRSDNIYVSGQFTATASFGTLQLTSSGQADMFLTKISPLPVKITDKQLPLGFALSQNYPNPFNPSTTISFELPERSEVSLQVFNALGEMVHQLAKGTSDAGRHSVTFNATNFPSGVYFYRLQAGEFVQTQKMVLIR